jgi:hypothetical protein
VSALKKFYVVIDDQRGLFAEFFLEEYSAEEPP